MIKFKRPGAWSPVQSAKIDLLSGVVELNLMLDQEVDTVIITRNKQEKRHSCSSTKYYDGDGNLLLEVSWYKEKREASEGSSD